MKSIKAIFRRGQTSTKLDGQIHTPEDLSRSSSVTNLNADQNSPKSKTGTAKSRKSSSRDRLDKLVSGTGTTERKNERKGISKNNNKFDLGDQPLTLDSLQEIESLKSQLHQMATEKSSLALKLGEQKGQIHTLQHQIENLKMYQEQSNLQLEQLTEENTALRNRLRDVAHSPLSDNEKQQLLYESHRHHNSAPASIATNPLEDGNCGDITACPTPDWDKHSSSNVSDISVACLQDKINQMQETHYSTNEELQATLQELTDLQRQLTELQQENERLVEEKNLMFDSLCRQTERLKDTRQELESLKTLLYREKTETDLESAQEREEKLVDLLKSAQDEHESLISKHEQLSGELQESREANESLHDQLKALNDRNGTLESTLDAKNAEQKLLDQELTQARDQCNGKQIEINRLKDLLENARTKINELEQDRALSDKSELDEMLDNARKEKDSLESEVANLKEQLARSKNEVEKLKEQISILQEECKVIRNNARTIQSDLEYKYDKLASEKTALAEQLLKFQDIINELQVQAQCQEEDKRNLSDVLAETQRNLSESERKIVMLENELADVKKLRKDENEEWEKFQNDLLTSVRVANDFKTEAQQDLQKMIMENKEHRDKVRQLEAQLDKLKGSPAMPEDRRNSHQLPQRNVPKRIFGSLPNLLDVITDKEQAGKSTKRPKWMRHQKQLSQGEEKILESLHKMYDEIDPKQPDNMLTSEQAVVKKLKTLYETESTAYKPVAPRRKQELAISKPLLESVYSNPKLESFAKNPNLKSLEADRFSWMGHKKFADDRTEKVDTSSQKQKPTKSFISYFEETREPPASTSKHQDTSPMDNPKKSRDEQTEHNQEYKPKLGNAKSFVSYVEQTPESSQRISSTRHHRSYSMDSPKEFPLRRYSSKEDLTGLAELNSFKRTSNVTPGKRSSLKSCNSDASSNISQRKRVSFDEKRNSCVVIKEFLSFESMENIYKSIDPKIPEEQLTKEQRFALRLKASIENLGQKPELRKRSTFRKSKVTISSPLKESVLRNTKLLSFIKDPVVRTAGQDPEQETVELRKVHRMKKYLGDTNRVLKNPSKAMCKRDLRLSRSMEDIKSFPQVFWRISSSMENLPSEEDVEPTIEIKVVTKILPAESYAATLNVSSGSSSVDNSVEDLVGEKQEAPVVFIEHYQTEDSVIVSEEIEDKFQIRDITVDGERYSFVDDGYTGRVSFPPEEENEEDKICRMRLLSINSVEMEEEDDVLARYRRMSEYKEGVSDEESCDVQREEDSQSFYSVELKAQEDSRSNSGQEENWLNKYLDQNCDIEDKKESRKMRVLYKDVVQEIKRKYSSDQQCSSDSSEDENVHIFNPKEGKIEVRELEDDDDFDGGSQRNFFDNFFKPQRPFLVKNESGEVGKSDSCPKTKNVEDLHPTEEEIAYIKKVREEYKEEFEDIDRLGHTDAQSDHYKKFLLRQDALDNADLSNGRSSTCSLKEKREELSNSEMELLSSIRRRHSRPLSDINMDDMAFINSMREKYLEVPFTPSHEPGFSDFYLKYITEEFLLEEMKSSQRNVDDDATFSTKKLCRDPRDLENDEMKNSTEIFLERERKESGQLKFRNCETENYTRDDNGLEEKDSLTETPCEVEEIEREKATTCYSDFYLRYLTSDFLTQEVNHNIYFEHPKKTDSRNSSELKYRTEIYLDSRWSSPTISKISESEGNEASTVVADLEQRQSSMRTYENISKLNSNTVCIDREDHKSPTKSTGWLYHHPVQEIQNSQNPLVVRRKPRPLPRKSSRDIHPETNKNTEEADLGSSVTREIDNVNAVRPENEANKEILPNFSEIMDARDTEENRMDKMNVQMAQKTSEDLSVDSAGSSKVTIRKTKKFIKEGDVLEEFDEASGVYNVRVDDMLEEDGDPRNRILPESLIDYPDSDSKITLISDGSCGIADFREVCSRPQTSTQRSTPFRLSYYGESSDEADEFTPRTSKENVARLKQKFETLLPDRSPIVSQEIKEAEKADLTKLLKEKTAYDLVFKTESKFWFDNSSETSKPDRSVDTSTVCFDTTTPEKPLNITILDPVESKTNVNYRHLFENEAVNRALRKPFGGDLKLSERNLKTSIPCVDFTSLSRPVVEKGSNASLFNFGMRSEGSSAADGAACVAKDS